MQKDRGEAERRWQMLLRIEVALVLALSLGRSGIYALTALIVRLTDRAPLREQQAALNAAISERPTVDLVYQLLAITFALVPVMLVIYFLVREGTGGVGAALARLGLRGGTWARDMLLGVGFTALIGIPGLGLYLLGRQLGITVQVITAAPHTYWWTIPVLIVAAAKNAVLEEIIAVGYLTLRASQFGWRASTIVLASALLRASYHLYQGFGSGLGNAVMGVIFAGYFYRTNRLWPLIIAHTLIDIVAFVGYALFADQLAAWL